MATLSAPPAVQVSSQPASNTLVPESPSAERPGHQAAQPESAPALSSPKLAAAVGGAQNVQLQLAAPAAAEPYRVLKQLFERAGDPVAITDVEAVDATAHAQKCVNASPTTRTQDALTDIDLWTAVAKKIAGSAPHGPLFPTDTRQPRETRWVGFGQHANAERIGFDKIKVSATPTQITSQVFDGETKPYFQSRIRKSGDLVAFELSWPTGSSGEVDYGYCWKK